jgi:hypothetical protein
VQEFVQVAPASLAGKVGIISGGDEADSFGGASKHITDRVGQNLKFIGFEANLIMDNVVMGGTSRALKSSMCY